MTTDPVPTVDHDHVDIGMVDQRVRERHPRRPCTDDQIVGFEDRDHGLMLRPPDERVNR